MINGGGSDNHWQSPLPPPPHHHHHHMILYLINSGAREMTCWNSVIEMALSSSMSASSRTFSQTILISSWVSSLRVNAITTCSISSLVINWSPLKSILNIYNAIILMQRNIEWNKSIYRKLRIFCFAFL